MPYVIRKTGTSVIKNFANAEQRVFLEERKARVLRKETILLAHQIGEQKEELRELAIEQDKRLSDLIDPQEEQNKLTSKNKELTKEVVERQGALDGVIESKRKLPDSIKKQVTKEKQILTFLNGKVSIVSEKIGRLENTKKELEYFIQKKSYITREYKLEKLKLDKITKETDELRIEFAEKKEWILKRTKELDEYQEMMKEYSGRHTSNIHKVQQITKLMNEKMKRENILIRLELPVDKIDIPF